MIKHSPELETLLAAAKARWDAMMPIERDGMIEQQREGYVRAEMAWPKPKYKWIDDAKGYDSYEDYCND